MSGKGYLARRRYQNEIKELLSKVERTYGVEAFEICADHAEDCFIHSNARRCVFFGLAEWMEKVGWFSNGTEEDWSWQDEYQNCWDTL